MTVKNPTTSSPTETSSSLKSTAAKKSPTARKRRRRRTRRSNASPLLKIFLNELADILHAEKQLVKALPALARGANDEQLKQALTDHVSVTREHVERDQRIFRLLRKTATTRPCVGMRGIIGEAKKVLHEESSPGKDALIAAAAQKAEHYEIATYGTLLAWAKRLGSEEIVPLLEKTLRDEESADVLLTRISEGRLNPEAVDKDTDQSQKSKRTDMPNYNQSGWEQDRGNRRSGTDRGGQYDNREQSSQNSSDTGSGNGRRRYSSGDDEDMDQSGYGRRQRESSSGNPYSERDQTSDRSSFRTEYDDSRRSYPRLGRSNQESGWSQDDDETYQSGGGSYSGEGRRRSGSGSSGGSYSSQERDDQGRYEGSQRRSYSQDEGYRDSSSRSQYGQGSYSERSQGGSRSSSDRTYAPQWSNDDNQRDSSRSGGNRSSRQGEGQRRYQENQGYGDSGRERSSRSSDTDSDRSTSGRRSGVTTAGGGSYQREDRESNQRSRSGSGSGSGAGSQSSSRRSRSGSSNDEDDDRRSSRRSEMSSHFE